MTFTALCCVLQPGIHPACNKKHSCWLHHSGYAFASPQCIILCTLSFLLVRPAYAPYGSNQTSCKVANTWQVS